MATGVKEAYSEVFETYPDAHLQGDDTLKGFFRYKTGLSDKTIGCILRTFRTLVEFSDFATSEPVSSLPDPVVEPKVKVYSDEKSVALSERRGNADITVNVNIQLVLPDTKDQTLYDRFFESLKRHILSYDG